ncbi:transcriptional regulator [endosymbiont 'TC1' of Trimyema compressum]|uniref:winged helix-turn-helix transcriptional regulator n=1 Tax=endosymbiont 'TC1' of Trimyema compressum TaxID=243899 RepID=UPI0007F0DB67|nr:helix-turn-helix domain-containing protein [endosymbiont 'TC1' of Trimyema compressum]AMP20118.1 transcriptional regulator [endosymbiont 'TC1' of Trimyema compressum]
MNNLYDGTCGVVNMLNSISGKWKLPVLRRLSFRIARYNELKRQVKGITNIMLTRTLHDLECNGLVIRKQYNEVPPKVEYQLTKHGKRLIPALEILKEWAESRLE